MLSVNIILPYLDFFKMFYEYTPGKITASELAARCQVLYRKTTDFFYSVGDIIDQGLKFSERINSKMRGINETLGLN